MTGFLLFTLLILLLVAALELTHRRAKGRWRPGRDDRHDRDSVRLAEELRVIAQAERGWARSAGGAPSELSLLSPRSAETDARLITRNAA